MKNPIRALLTAVVLATLAVAARAVEATWNYAVQVTAAVQSSPASITLSWTQDTTATPSSYTVYRKLAGATSWGSGTTLPGSATSYKDSSVTVGTAYEYQIVKAASGYTGYGYVQAGINVSLVENRGKIVLVVDNTHASALSAELTRLEQDLVGDGWSVVRRDVARTDSPAAVKTQIKSVYSADPANVKAVFLFGHVPVPYSGQFNPDGHPDHIGAWPADVYYGDMDGNWTDSTVNYTQTLNTDKADAARISNKPGDGKFDQTTLPSPVELWVGRVDLANMPGKTSWNSPNTFPSEVELLRQYLNKDHNFRHRKVNVQRRAIVGDYFGVRSGEAFAASGYRSAAPLVGNDKITNLNVLHNDKKGVWVPALAAGDYLFAYGCGAGSYRSIAGLGNIGQYNDGNTTELVSNDVHGVFNMLFGSWLGDWDHEDSMLRAPLATKTHGLTSVWSGRPHWFMHPMGLGEPIGLTAKIAQNNANGLYKTQRNSNVGNVHVALMGDPTLRLHPVAPPSSVGGTVSGSTVTLTWGASSDNVVGYHVYRATSAAGPYTRLTSSLTSSRSFTDSSAPSGASYMVRAVKLETSPSGSYYNPSQGVFWKVGGAGPVSGGDTTAPTVSLTAPANGASISGSSVAVTANAADSVGVAGVQFLLDGQPLGTEDTAAPYSTTWNSTTATNGSHVLTAVARDAAGNKTTSAAVTVNVSNSSTSPTSPTSPTTSTHWVDDALPAGASGSGSGGDTWNWVTAGPTPFSGSKAHQSAAATGLHEHSFNWASATMAVQTGDVLYTYVYLDPANPPTEVMVSWLSDNWEHRAYWGANSINYGKDGTNSRRKVGVLPAAGQWVRLEVPASQVGLEGHTVKGMSFALYGGRATWDAAGRAPAGSTSTPPPTTDSGTAIVTVAATDTNAVIGTNDYSSYTFTRSGGSTSTALKVKFTLGGTAVKWIDYRRPEGDMPVEFTIPAGATSATMNLRALANSTKATLQTVVVTLANDSAYTVGTAKSATTSITAVGQAVPTLPGGTASTDPVSNGSTGGTSPAPSAPTGAWIDDALPAGAKGSGTGGDTWTWVAASPSPVSGAWAHQSALAAGLHEHSFNYATATMAVASGDVLYAYIYLDPANPPTEVMLSWLSDNWEHRAYWGANQINYGKDGTNGRRRMGDLPAAGQWVRLEVPASQVGLEGHKVKGMSFALFGGRATWDAAGSAPAGSSGGTAATPSGPATVTLTASDTTAVINSTNFGAITFTRTGDTASALKVKFAYSGTAVKWLDYRRPEGDIPTEFTIPAGATSATMKLKAIANVTNANPQTVTVTLAADSAYTVGTQKAGTVTISPAGTVVADVGTDLSLGTGDTTDPTGTSGTGSTGSGSTGSTGSTGSSTPTGSLAAIAAMSVVDYAQLAVPATGSATLHVLSPTTLELVRVNAAPTGTAVDSWNFIDATGAFVAPANSRFNVTVNGQPVAVQSVGFKRRPLYAPLVSRDLRVVNSLVLQLASPVTDGQSVEVKNPDAGLWPASMVFKATATPLRYSPAVHVNQEGYVPGLPKKAQVGYYLGNLGEMNIATTTFTLVNASGATVHTGTLRARPDSGWTYTPAPYQKVYEADFSSFATPGEYRLVVPGLGASLPFRIDDGVAMNFARTYALGLYHQRCGHANALPFTRHTHDACHTAAASVPLPAGNFGFTWTTVTADAAKVNSNNPAQTAPKLTESTQLFPFKKTGTLDVAGGHHDAGDYSKYTINSAGLVHFLMFAVDSLAGVAALDNLGLPESGDGVSDLLQEAKIEADFLAKLQDTDGGFFFLVYPRNRRYESNVLPDRGDEQVVWPKNTAATAAAVAALAETASSPRFKAAYPKEAADYLAKAKLGWKFLTDAVAKHGKAGAYQKLTHYGDDFTHDDELAWAAAAMFAATGDAAIHATLKSWYDPASPSTWRWGWWHGYMSFGNAVRSYAFAVRSGRLPASALDAGYLTKCEAEVRAAANDAVKWSGMSAYGTSFPDASKRQMSAGWYFSAGQAFDLAVARQLEARSDYLDAMVANLNYEGGSNGVNVTYVTGLGWKRQKEIVHQYAQNDDRALPPGGIPLGGLQTGPVYTATYGTDLAALTFPRDNAASGPHGFYDRWTDTFNVATEFVHLDQARSLAASAYLATLTSAKSQAWKPAAATITGIPATPSLGTPITVSLAASGLDLSTARILWEAKGSAPAWGATYTFTPGGYGSQWVEAEAQWADGRRVVARATLFAENGLPTVSVAATDATATIGSATDTATWTFTRTGSTTEAIKVPFKFSGTAVKWNDFRRPEGDMPADVTIPAGATTATLTIKAIANTTNANPQTATLTLSSGSGFNVGTPYSATVTIK